MVFIEIQNLYKLEKEHKWKQIISLLQNKWYHDKNNIDIMLRLASECWYIMSNWDLLDLNNSDLDFDNVQSLLIETYDYFSKNCTLNNKALAIFGYMISLFPNYFYTDYDKNGKIFFSGRSSKGSPYNKRNPAALRPHWAGQAQQKGRVDEVPLLYRAGPRPAEHRAGAAADGPAPAGNQTRPGLQRSEKGRGLPGAG